MPNYPIFYVKADSENRLRTSGSNDVTGLFAISEIDGTPMTNLTAKLYVTVTALQGNITQAKIQMTYVSTGVWEYVLPATVWPTGHGPWIVKVEVYDIAGSPTGPAERTFYATAREFD